MSLWTALMETIIYLNPIMEKLTILCAISVSFTILFAWFFARADADFTLLYCERFRERKQYTDQVVWITGASSGIGEHMAYEFATRGAKLVLSGVNLERLDKVAKRCIVLGCTQETVIVLPFLIENFDVHDECVKKVLERFGQIDILVNNAGFSQRAEFQDIDIEVDQKLFNVNVFGSVNLTRKVLKHFLEKNEGHVVVTSSLAGKLGAPFSSAYTGSKHALHGYFEGLRSEMAQKNIDVTIACPGPVFSGITNRCVTGKVGEIFNQTERPTDNKMETSRCSKLILIAIENKLDECWISLQPLLVLFFVVQYMPTIFRRVLLPRFFSKERIQAIRLGRDD